MFASIYHFVLRKTPYFIFLPKVLRRKFIHGPTGGAKQKLSRTRLSFFVYVKLVRVGQKCYDLELSFCDFPEQVGYELILRI